MDIEKIKNELKSRINKFEEKDLEYFNQHKIDYTLFNDNILSKDKFDQHKIDYTLFDNNILSKDKFDQHKIDYTLFDNNILSKDKIDYTLFNDNIRFKDKFEEYFISQNTDLFNLNRSNLSMYYSLIFSRPKYKIYNLTLNGRMKWKNLSDKLLQEPNSITFFNIRNIVLYNTSDNNLRNYIIRMFTTRNIVFQDWNITIESLIGNSKLDVIFFTSRQFYKLSVKNVLYTYEDIPDYFRFTNIEDKKIKCDLCQTKNYK